MNTVNLQLVVLFLQIDNVTFVYHTLGSIVAYITYIKFALFPQHTIIHLLPGPANRNHVHLSFGPGGNCTSSNSHSLE